MKKNKKKKSHLWARMRAEQPPYSKNATRPAAAAAKLYLSAAAAPVGVEGEDGEAEDEPPVDDGMEAPPVPMVVLPEVPAWGLTAAAYLSHWGLSALRHELWSMQMAWRCSPWDLITVAGGLQARLKSLLRASATAVMSSLATPKEAAARPTCVMK